MKTKLLLILLLLSLTITAQTNLVPNGNFETWSSSSQPDNWYGFLSGYLSQSTTAQNGKSSTNMMIATGTFNYINSNYFAVQANKTYRVTLYHRAVKGTFSSLDFSLYHKPSTFKEEIIKKSDVTFSTTEWRKIEFEYTSKVAENIEVDIWTNGSLNSEILIDNVSVIDVADIPAQYTLIPDVNFEKKLIALGIDSGATDGKVLTSKVEKLTSLDVSYSSITDLTGIQDFVSLTGLYTLQNKLVTLDVSQNINLTILRCDNNTTLETLDVSQNTKLTQLLCGSNKIKNLDLSKLTMLKELYCDRNQLTNIDFSTNIQLEKLYINENQLTKLDLSKNAALKYLNCTYNRPMSELNLKNGKNNLIDKNSLYLTNNASLTCILVDDVAYANTNWEKSKDISVDFSLVCSTPEYTLIPDAEFEKKIIASGYDLVQDGKVLTRKIAAAEYLNLDDAPITDLTGLESFTNLKTLYCSKIKVSSYDFSKNTQLTDLSFNGNNAKSIDVSSLLALKKLQVSSNNLTSIDLSKNLALETLYLDKNKLTEINFSANKNLTTLSCSNNPITKINTAENPALTYLSCTDVSIKSLNLTNNLALKAVDFERNIISDIDVSKNTALEFLNCAQNPISSLNLTNNKNLKTLNCSGSYYQTGIGGAGKITTLNLYNNTLLTSLDCSSNQLSKLDLSSNTKIEILRCYGNILNDLDLSKNTALTLVSASDNKLKSINFKNGNNTKATTVDFKFNPSLDCIQVDDIDYANTNWSTKKDVTSNFSTNCAYSILIPDPNFEDKLIALGIDSGVKDGKVLTSNIVNLTSLDVSNSKITDLTGIESFVSLESLTANENSLTKLNISENQKLANLNVSKNQLTRLYVNNNINLQTIYCSDNLLTNLDLSKNTSLITVYCPNNKLISLNLKNGNNVTSDGLGIKNFTSNPDLRCIQVDDETYANTKWASYKDGSANYSSNCDYSTAIPDPKFEDKLIALGIDSGEKDGKVATSNINGIIKLDLNNSEIKSLIGIQDFTSLKTLSLKNNQLSTLDLSKNNDLVSLDASLNKLTSIDISKNTNLISLDASLNEITSIDVSKNTKLGSLVITNNQFTEVDISKNTNLTTLNVNYNKISTIDVSKNTLLGSLSAVSNKLESVNISNNKNLSVLDIASNQISSLDVSQNTLLQVIKVSDNILKTFDVSKNPSLTFLTVNNNQLTSLNLKNGKNTFLTNGYISLYTNAKLYCILVDDVTYANTYWLSRKDAIATYNTECNGELTLPANNFTVETKGESCLGENNGEISIVAKTTFAYAATINDKAYSFTNNSLKVANLTPGVYKIKITIPEMIFEQNFTVIIAKGATITGKSSITSKTVDVEITEGTAPFTVFVDGTEQFKTNDATFSVDVTKNALVEVATAKACEGVFAKKVSVSDFESQLLTAYPNPTSGSFEIEIPGTKNEVTIELYNFSGQLISAKTYPVESGKAQLNLENQPSGIYAAKIYLATPEYIKIIKK